MGIKGLMKFLSENAPRSIKQVTYDSFTGRKIAIDASMSLYQFMIAIRDGDSYASFTNESGETTSHIMGMLSRVIRLLEHGIKPVYVFDGKPPEMKSGELLKRSNRRKQAEEELEAAREAGNQDDIKKFVGRTVRVTSQHNDDIKELLRLMGIPIVQAVHDAESQCAALAKSGKVYATGTDDADALTFGTPVQIRHLNFSEQKVRQNPVLEVSLEAVLSELGLTMEQFIDFCILCGCDYCDTIKGVGPSTAFKWVKEQGSLENIMEKLDRTKYEVPDRFPFKEVRDYFLDPKVLKDEEVQLAWGEPDVEGLRKFLVETHGFNAKRFDNAMERLKKSKSKSSQCRLENFFGNATVKPNEQRLKKEAEAKAAAKAKAKAAGAKKRPLAGDAKTPAGSAPKKVK